MLYVDLFAQDGVDNSGVKADALYTTPQQVNLCLYKNFTDLSQSFNRLEPFLAGVQSPSSTFPHQPHVLHRCCLRKCPRRLQGEPNQRITFKIIISTFYFSSTQSGNVVLSPHLLKGHQQFAKEQLKCSEDKPLFLVMHGGSGSTAAEIGEAVGRQSLLYSNTNTNTQIPSGEQWGCEDEC